ncbi:MAG: YbaB/EbfC family nucleoid-associated protein [Ruminococcus sp.]|nr:YbaB/EbfC family nucleoid-associated protein [Ruminococcus sp.]
MKARLPQGYGGGGGGNMQQLARQAQKMQEAMETATAELEAKEYSATAGGGAVKVVVTGKLEVKSIDIEPEVIDPDDAEMLSDHVMAATNEALRAANQDKEETMGALSGGLNIPGLF